MLSLPAQKIRRGCIVFLAQDVASSIPRRRDGVTSVEWWTLVRTYSSCPPSGLAAPKDASMLCLEIYICQLSIHGCVGKIGSVAGFGVCRVQTFQAIDTRVYEILPRFIYDMLPGKFDLGHAAMSWLILDFLARYVPLYMINLFYWFCRHLGSSAGRV